MLKNIITFLFVIAFISAKPTVSNSAQWEIVSFNDAEHLAALQDSVVGVRDTVGGYYYNPDCPGDTVWFDMSPNTLAWLINCEGMLSLYDSTYQVNWRYVDKTITCRRLVGVEVTKESSITIVEQIARGYLGNIEHYKKVARGEAPPMPTEIITVGSPGQAIIFYKSYKEEQCTK